MNFRSELVSIPKMSRTLQRLALLVGINRYRHLGPTEHLRGAVRDIEDMAELLAGRFGFPVTGIRLLRDEAATRCAVLDALADLAEQATPDTVVVIHWSGHGSQVPAPPLLPGEVSGSPGQEETLVPHDARGDGVRDITDKELLVHLARLHAQGAFVTWIADACHSGHIYRDRRFGRARRVAPDPWVEELPVAPSVHCPEPPPGPRGWLRHGDRQVLLAACHADQEAFERPLLEHETHGEWTFALLQVLRRAPVGATARQIYHWAMARLLAADVPQSPQLVGARDRLIFGVEARPQVPFVEVRARTGHRVELAAGRAQGLIEDSLWDVHAAGAHQPSCAAMAVRVRIVRVGAFSSEGEVEVGERSGSSARAIEAGDRAFEAIPAYGEMRLGVRLLGAAATELGRELARRILASPVLREVEPDDEDSVAIELSAADCLLVDARGFLLAEPLPSADVHTAGRVLDRLERRARWRHGLHLENRDPESQVGSNLRVKLLRQEAPGTWQPAPLAEGSQAPGSAGHSAAEYRSGDLVALEVSHQFAADLYVYVLDFGLTDGVTQIFPPPGGEERMVHGSILRPGTLPGDGFELWLPDEVAQRGGGIGFLKLFATTHPTDFDWLRTDVRLPSTYRAGPASLARLLAMAAKGPVLRRHGEDWGTVLLPIRLRSE